MEADSDIHLLYVEDNADLRDVLSELLSGEGYEVRVAKSADEGLERLREQRFHLVISDYALPDHTGTWMLREATARGLLDRTLALIVTATIGVEDVGDVPVLSKPVDFDVLLRCIRALISGEDLGAPGA